VPTAHPASSPATAASTATSLLWLWILIGAVLLIVLIVAITRAGRRRSAAAARWRSQVIEAYAKGSALYDAMSVALTPEAMAARDTAARWSDIRRRADDMAEILYRLREAARREEDRARVNDTLAALQAARSAMEAGYAPGGTGLPHAAVVSDRLAAFEAALRALRSAGGLDAGGPPA